MHLPLIRSRQIQDFTKSKGSDNVYPFCTKVKCFIVSFFSVYSSCIHFSSERYFNDIQIISSIPGVEWRENNLICDSLFFSCRAWILLGKGTACVTLLRHRISQSREWNTNHSKRSRCVEFVSFIGDDLFWLFGPLSNSNSLIIVKKYISFSIASFIYR